MVKGGSDVMNTKINSIGFLILIIAVYIESTIIILDTIV